MQWGCKVVTFKSCTVGATHLAPHVTVDQIILDRPHSVEFAPVDQKFLFKGGLVRLRQLAEQVSLDQFFTLINFHDAGLPSAYNSGGVRFHVGRKLLFLRRRMTHRSSLSLMRWARLRNALNGISNLWAIDARWSILCCPSFR